MTRERTAGVSIASRCLAYSSLLAAVALVDPRAAPPRKRCWRTSTGGRSIPTGEWPASPALLTGMASPQSVLRARIRTGTLPHLDRHTPGGCRIPRSVSKQGLVVDQSADGRTGDLQPGQHNRPRAQRFHQQRVRFRRARSVDRQHHRSRSICSSSGRSSRTTAARRTCRTYPDARQGYGKLQGPWVILS